MSAVLWFLAGIIITLILLSIALGMSLLELSFAGGEALWDVTQNLTK